MNHEQQLMAALDRYDARRMLHRGHCTACGWHGRALADERQAQFTAAKHWQQTGHMATDVQSTEASSNRLPGSWQ